MLQVPPLFRCTFGLRAVPCESAHNYFWDPGPVVDARGPLVAWPNDGCPGSLAAGWASTTASLRSTFEKVSTDESKASVIVFVLRGGCSFADKVLTILNAVSHAAAARPRIVCAAVAIVDVPSPVQLGGVAVAASAVAVPGLGDVKGIHVPVVMVAHADAAQLFPGQFIGATTMGAAGGAAASIDPTNFPQTAFETAGTVVNDGGQLTGAVVLVSATLDSLRGRGHCQCSVEAPLEMAEWHLMHREG